MRSAVSLHRFYVLWSGSRESERERREGAKMVTPVPDHMDFPAEEKNILELWKGIDAFQTCLKQSKDKPKYTFYDGPPFATGLPHYGHILAGTIKDVVTRYAHQSGFHVARRFGWDCHGLPVEYEIDKTLGIKSHEDVEKMGVANYNAECRKIVMRYSSEWENIVTRMGRWIDFKNDYKTLYPWFMESVWWVFRQIYDKGLVYRGWKIMPFSTQCHTPLSNFEAGQNYKDVQDPAIIVNFPLDEDPSVSIIAWTTTPWTLPSNLALCVHPEFTYVKVKDNKHGVVYIMLKDRLSALFKDEDECTILEEIKGECLVGKKYEPLFDYFAHMKSSEPGKGAFRVISDTYVSSDSGTGIVHQAPGFGEDDLRACIHFGVVLKGESVVCPVDYSGRFTDRVTDFKGQYVKDADKGIMKMLKEKGRLVHQSTITHSYPFCWRSETPLIYRAVPSWFIRVEMIVQQLLENNNKCYWVPEFVKAKRFANWLRDARDWAVSRNRYWGTPIPIWASDDFSEVVCVGSVEELEQLSGVKVSDLHRENVDDITIPSCRGNGVLKRVSEVFDCWFESGSMPYAQSHYPFENKKTFETTFPADFIAEGVDQTRGWFYTLLVVSTALFNKPPYKNLIVNGLVLASNGQKMSKRLKNYPDPMNVVKDFGADALRLYLINSPVVRAESLRFQEKGVKDVVKDVFLPWFNAYRFLIQNVLRLKQEEGMSFTHVTDFSPVNTMDRWIISFTQSLVIFMRVEMSKYRLYTVVPRLVKFIDQLTNWYVRSNRKRIKGELGKRECLDSIHTLFSVLYSMTRMMAPFTPFLTEHMFQNLRRLLPWELNDSNTSLHYIMMPKPRPDLIDKEIERAVALMQSVVETGRYIRDRVVVPIKFPLPEVVVIHRDPGSHDDLEKLEHYILEELNVKVLTLATEDSKYGVQLQAEPDSERLGKRLKGDFKRVAPAIKALSNEQLVAFQNEGMIEVEGHELTAEDIKISYAVAESLSSRYHAHASGTLLVLLDVTPSQEMVDEGVAREVINKIQKLRKKAGLQPRDSVEVLFKVNGGEVGGASLTRVIAEHKEYIETTTKGPLNPWTLNSDLSHKIIEDEQKMKGLTDVVLHLWIIPKPESSSGTSSIPVGVPIPDGGGLIPFCRYVNLCLAPGSTLRPAGFQATLLLENPVGENVLTVDQLQTEACNLLKSYLHRDLHIWMVAKGNAELVTSSCDLLSLNGQTLYICDKSIPLDCRLPPTSLLPPFSPFANISLDDGRQATVLLENPKGVKMIAESDAKNIAKQLF